MTTLPGVSWAQLDRRRPDLDGQVPFIQVDLAEPLHVVGQLVFLVDTGVIVPGGEPEVLAGHERFLELLHRDGLGAVEGDGLDAGPGALFDEEGQGFPLPIQGLDHRHDARAEVAFILVEKPEALDAVFDLLLVQERLGADRQFFGQFLVLDVVVAVIEDLRHKGFLRDDENHRHASGHRLSLHTDVLEVPHLVDRADLLPELLSDERLAFLQRDTAPDGRRLDPLVALDLDRLDQLSRFLRNADTLAVGPDEPHPHQAPDPQYRGHPTGGSASE